MNRKYVIDIIEYEGVIVEEYRENGELINRKIFKRVSDAIDYIAKQEKEYLEWLFLLLDIDFMKINLCIHQG